MARRREFEYLQPDWRQTVATLSNGAPANVADLHALLVDHLRDQAAHIAVFIKDFGMKTATGESRIRNPKKAVVMF
jgi:hypothetical protein